MKKRYYIANESDAVCKSCGLPCSPVYESGEFDYEYGSIKGRHSFGSEWLSDCCSDDMLDESGGEWVADLEEWFDE